MGDTKSHARVGGQSTHPRLLCDASHTSSVGVRTVRVALMSSGECPTTVPRLSGCPVRALIASWRWPVGLVTLGGMTTTIDDDDLDELRAILVEELASLHELRREVEAGLASRYSPEGVAARIEAVERLAKGVGGLGAVSADLSAGSRQAGQDPGAGIPGRSGVTSGLPGGAQAGAKGDRSPRPSVRTHGRGEGGVGGRRREEDDALGDRPAAPVETTRRGRRRRGRSRSTPPGRGAGQLVEAAHEALALAR